MIARQAAELVIDRDCSGPICFSRLIAVLAFGGVVEKAGVLDKIISPIIAAMVAAVFATSVVTPDQYICLGGCSKAPSKRVVSCQSCCSRTIGGAATPTSALVPWNSCGAYMAATLGVATLKYAPYAIFNMISPLVVIAVAFSGVRMLRGSGIVEESSPGPSDTD